MQHNIKCALDSRQHVPNQFNLHIRVWKTRLLVAYDISIAYVECDLILWNITCNEVESTLMMARRQLSHIRQVVPVKRHAITTTCRFLQMTPNLGRVRPNLQFAYKALYQIRIQTHFTLNLPSRRHRFGFDILCRARLEYAYNFPPMSSPAMSLINHV